MWPLVGETLSNHTRYKRKREEESEHIKLGGERDRDDLYVLQRLEKVSGQEKPRLLAVRERLFSFPGVNYIHHSMYVIRLLGLISHNHSTLGKNPPKMGELGCFSYQREPKEVSRSV